MPFYFFKVTYKIDSGRKYVSGIRELEVKDLDTVWRHYKRICEQEYSQRLNTFEVTHLSKLDPRVIKFQQNRGTKSNSLTSVINETYKEIDNIGRSKKKP